jgi:replicative DNA helicase
MLIDAMFEDKTLAGVMRSNEFASIAAPHIQALYFEGTLKQNLAHISLDFWNRYKTHMTDFGFVEEVKRLVAEGKLRKEDVAVYATEYKRLKGLDLSDWKFVIEGLIDFVKQREYRALIEEAVKKLLPRSQFDELEKRFGAISRITTTGQVDPVDYYSDEEIGRREKRREDEKAHKIRGISTGIKKLDEALPRGGWCPKELYSISGGAKRGKTQSMLWFGHAATLQGFNVAYFSCEVSEEVISDRLDAMITETEIKHLSDDIKAVLEALKTRRPTGKFYIFEYPTDTLTVSECERQIRRLQMEKGVALDMAITDYAGIMRPERRYKDNELKEEAEIFKGQRRLAGIFGIPWLTGNQNNRAGAQKALSDGTDTAGTWEKIAIVDGNITLSGTKEELRDGILRLHLSEMRNAPSRTFKIKTAYNMGRFYKEFIEEEC